MRRSCSSYETVTASRIEGRTLTVSLAGVTWTNVDRRRSRDRSNVVRASTLEFPRNFRKKLRDDARYVDIVAGSPLSPASEGKRKGEKATGYTRWSADSLYGLSPTCNLNPGAQRGTFSTRVFSRPVDELWQPGKWLLQLRPRDGNIWIPAGQPFMVFLLLKNGWTSLKLRLVVRWSWTGVEHLAEGDCKWTSN